MTVKLHHEIAGHGPRIALLHPVGLDLTFLAPVAAAMKKDFTVLTVDQRGHGQSSAKPPANSLEDYADDLHALFNDIGFAPAAIVGFSFGGMVAQELALRYPTDVSALVICASRCTLTDEGRAISRARGDNARGNGIESVLEATLDRWFTAPFRAAGKDAPSRARLLSNNVDGWAQAWHAMANINTLPRLPTLHVPTLCLAGELDKSSPPEALRQIANTMSGARYAELKGAPHMLFIEQPLETAKIVGDFLHEVLGSRA
jgi:3-oxoadipate enol-lactonase